MCQCKLRITILRFGPQMELRAQIKKLNDTDYGTNKDIWPSRGYILKCSKQIFVYLSILALNFFENFIKIGTVALGSHNDNYVQSYRNTF